MHSLESVIKSINSSSNGNSLAGFFAYHLAKNDYEQSEVKSFEEEIEENLYRFSDEGANFDFGVALDIALNMHIRQQVIGE